MEFRVSNLYYLVVEAQERAKHAERTELRVTIAPSIIGGS